MTLHLNFTVLLPASNVLRHVVKFNFLFQKFIHLAFYGILFAILDKGCTKIDRRHSIEVFMGSTETSKDTKVRIKEILAMSTIWYAIIYNLLQNYLHSSFTVER